LAKTEDVQEILALFEAHFSPDEQLPELVAPCSIPFAEPVKGADPGVEVEAGMSYDQLRSNLSLDKDGRLILFNQVRHIHRLTSWTSVGAAAFETRDRNPHLFKPIRMHWHQLAGTHAILRRFFTSKRSVTNILGMLIADDVGLGKSFMAALTAAFLIELGIRQTKNSPLPPLVRKCFSIFAFSDLLTNHDCRILAIPWYLGKDP
jgi:TATA-binding protein-associated factor